MNKSSILGIFCIIAAAYLMFTSKNQPIEKSSSEQTVQAGSLDSNKSQIAPSQNAIDKASDDKTSSKESANSIFSLEKSLANEPICLKNDLFEISFTQNGAAIDSVKLLKFKQTNTKNSPAYTFNDGALVSALALAFDVNGKPFKFDAPFTLVEKTPTKLVFELNGFDKKEAVKIIRTYELSKDYSYVLNHQTKIVKNQDSANILPFSSKMYLNLGIMPPSESDVGGMELAYGYLNKQGDDKFFNSGKLLPSSGFLGLGKNAGKSFIELSANETGDILWSTIKNQFFAAVLTNENCFAQGAYLTMQELSQLAGEEKANLRKGLTAYTSYKMDLNSGYFALDAQYYVGPKEYFMLEALPNEQSKVMDFGFFGVISKPLLMVLKMIHNVFAGTSWSWGWAIICLTVLIKLILWPLTNKQIVSMKKMGKLAEPIKALKEKLSSNPQKFQKLQLELWKENKVNPLAGCLPILIQFPIFIGLYYMLRTSCELRFAPFLWVSDLSQPDVITIDGKVLSVFGIPLHILPILNCIVMLAQMVMTPSANGDPIQKRMMYIMPLIFLPIFYTFASGLVLYWLTQSTLGILQQRFTHNKKVDFEVKIPASVQKILDSKADSKNKRK